MMLASVLLLTWVAAAGKVDVLTLAAGKRTVRTPLVTHRPGESLWFWNKPAAPLAIADYNGDGRPDFNVGQRVKWCQT